MDRYATQKVLDVVPSTISEMVFEARNELFNHKVNIILSFFFVPLLLVDGVVNDGAALCC